MTFKEKLNSHYAGEERVKLKGEKSKLIGFLLWKFAIAKLQLKDNDTRYSALMELKLSKSAVHRLSGCSRVAQSFWAALKRKAMFGMALKWEAFVLKCAFHSLS